MLRHFLLGRVAAYTVTGGHIMKQALILLTALCTAVPAYAQSVDAELDGIIKDAKGTFEKLTAIDKSDKALKASNDAQIFSTQAANKAEKEVKDATAPLQMDANRADQMRNQLLAMGCPENGGSVPVALAQRCNPLIAQHQALHDGVLGRANVLKNKMQTVRTLRENITKTTLKNAEQQKKNNDERTKLVAQKLEIKTRAVIAGLKNKAAAEKACGSMSTAEGQVCCHKVVFDGADPKLCGIELMCQAFEHGDVFGGHLMICQAASR
jgi:hypothetical protein